MTRAEYTATNSFQVKSIRMAAHVIDISIQTYFMCSKVEISSQVQCYDVKKILAPTEEGDDVIFVVCVSLGV